MRIRGVIVLRGNCPTNRGNCPRGNCPTGVMVLGGSCPGGNCPGGSCPRGVIALRGSCPRGSCPVTHRYPSILYNIYTLDINV